MSLPRRAHVVAGTHLFREQVVEAYLRGDDEPVPLRAAPPSTTSLVLVCGALVAFFVLVLAFGRVEITSRGRGVLRAEGGSQMLVTLASGTVAEVRARSGDHVERGQAVVVLDSASVKAALLEAERRVAMTERALADYRAKRKPLADRQLRELAKREAALLSRLEQDGREVARTEAVVERIKRLTAATVATAQDRDKAEEEWSRATAQRFATAADLARLREERAALELQIANDDWRLQAERDEALTKRDATAFSFEQTSICAPSAGTLESLTVRPGDGLAVGTTVARLVPSDVALQIVAFVPERDRAFLYEGSKAIIELDQLPAAEFGTLRGTVTRVAHDIAASHDVREVLGDASSVEPMYRVELALDSDARRARVEHRIRAGSLVSVRYVLRQRSVAAVVFAPIQRLLERP
ncbi:MAG TPA: HlyD family efflux transporter periplasmic adaptor subunit [Labilithrix sp.]|nr:HlyD family efflux transporter periplasmic adaptor subunit [Labilithrix sp.]